MFCLSANVLFVFVCVFLCVSCIWFLQQTEKCVGCSLSSLSIRSVLFVYVDSFIISGCLCVYIYMFCFFVWFYIIASSLFKNRNKCQQNLLLQTILLYIYLDIYFIYFVHPFIIMFFFFCFAMCFLLFRVISLILSESYTHHILFL